MPSSRTNEFFSQTQTRKKRKKEREKRKKERKKEGANVEDTCMYKKCRCWCREEMLRKKWINCSNSHLKKGDRDEMRKRESLQRDDELVECKKWVENKGGKGL